MDCKLFQKNLQENASEEEFQYWRKLTELFILQADLKSDDQKLYAVLVTCGASNMETISDCKTANEAFAKLEKKYVKRTTSIITRQNLRLRKQKADETVEEFINQIKSLAKKCPTPALTTEQHFEMIVADTLISGLSSSSIRQRLLETNEPTLDQLSLIAITMDLASQDAQKLNKEREEAYNASAIKKTVKTTQCFWCGNSRHTRQTCPARNSICKGCNKTGHWIKVCRQSQQSASISENNTQTSEDENITAGILASIIPKSNTVDILVNGIRTTALIDTGSDLSFIRKDFLQDHNLRYSSSKRRTISLANNSSTEIIGSFLGKVTLQKQSYHNELYILGNLVLPVIIGMDILSKHSSLTLHLGGVKNPLCLALKMSEFELMPGIDTKTLKPITTKSHRSHNHHNFIVEEIKRMLSEDIIQPSQSPWRAQVFVIKKESKLRMVVDYSKTINKYTPLDAYPMPRIDDLLNKVSQGKHFSKIDLKSAYHQVPLKEKDFYLTAFEANNKLYEFKRLPFGCTNAVSIFQRTIDNIIEKNNLSNTIAYLDDIIIFGSSKSDHDNNLQRCREVLEKSGLEINESKCLYNTNEITFLGHTISNGHIKPDPSRFKALFEFPCPTTPKKLDKLIGFFAYYAKWISKCSEKTKIISIERDRLEEGKELSRDAVNMIQTLKNELKEACLSIHNPNLPLLVETDASETALGGTLSQEGRPIAFFSRTLNKSEKGQAIVEKEAAAIYECCQKWRHLLTSVPYFDIMTDQRSVAYIYDYRGKSKIKNEKIARWRIELAELKYNVKYRPGPENIPADALSRCATSSVLTDLKRIHNTLCHPGVTRLNHYCKTKNLAYSIEEIRSTIKECQICNELKPRFYRPEQGTLISATNPWQRISMDFIGPLPSTSKKNSS